MAAAITNSDRVRSELRHDPRMRSRQIGRAIHDTMALLAAKNDTVTIDDVDTACEQALSSHPINAPQHLTRPLMYITTHAAAGMRLLPSLDWDLAGIEIDLPSGSRIDQLYTHSEPQIVGPHIGCVLGVEIKTAACVETPKLPDTVAQVNQHLDGLIELHGDLVIGVVVLCLGHPRRSLLTLPDPDRTEVLWFDSGLSTYPDGRLTV